jgi:hypothetical protein
MNRNMRLAVLVWATFTLSGCARALVKPEPLVSGAGVTHGMSATRSSGLPVNLDVAEGLRPILQTMWQHSRTFRAQCARIERAPSLQVVLTRERGTHPSTSGARTQFTRSNHRFHAAVILSLDVASNSLIELIAHELEHVVEQLDGVHLTGRAEKGISRNARDTFDTARASHIGQQVALEVRRGRGAVLSITQQ